MLSYAYLKNTQINVVVILYNFELELKKDQYCNI